MLSFNSFHGMEVKMMCATLPPYWMDACESAANCFQGSVSDGRDYIIIKTIAEALNMCIHLVPWIRNAGMGDVCIV